jgi:hypothetical protein
MQARNLWPGPHEVRPRQTTGDGERDLLSRERDVVELAERARRDRLGLTVCVERHAPHRPESIVILEPPTPFGPRA